MPKTEHLTGSVGDNTISEIRQNKFFYLQVVQMLCVVFNRNLVWHMPELHVVTRLALKYLLYTCKILYYTALLKQRFVITIKCQNKTKIYYLLIIKTTENIGSL